MHRDHCAPDPNWRDRADGKEWSTVKPLASHGLDLCRTVLVDNDSHKSVQGEESNMLLVPDWLQEPGGFARNEGRVGGGVGCASTPTHAVLRGGAVLFKDSNSSVCCPVLLLPAVSDTDLPVLVHLLQRLVPGCADVRPAVAAVSQGLVQARLLRFGADALPLNIPYDGSRVTHGVGPEGLDAELLQQAGAAAEEAVAAGQAETAAAAAAAAGNGHGPEVLQAHAAAAQALRGGPAAVDQARAPPDAATPAAVLEPPAAAPAPHVLPDHVLPGAGLLGNIQRALGQCMAPSSPSHASPVPA